MVHRPTALCLLAASLAAAILAVPANGAGPNLVSNPSFEGSLTGWVGWNATLALASDGVSGPGAAKVSLSGSSTSYSIYPSPRPVRSTVVGTTYVAGGWSRSATPGRQLCLRIREWSSAGSALGFSSTCVTSTSTWQEFPALSYTTQGAGGSVEVFVIQNGAVAGNSFEVDALSLATDTAPAPDTTPPTVALTAPADGSNVRGAVSMTADASDNAGVSRVEFLANDALVATDTAAPYSATWSSSPDGAATLSARAFDAAGNSATSSRTVTVDNTPPDTTLGSTPPASTTSTSASFAFSSEAGATFQCSLDSAAYQPCTSPASYSNLAAGSHTFGVRAVDSVGNVDSSPATYTWTVTSSPPPPPPSGGTNLIANGSFEGSLSGWGGWQATLALAADGIQGSGAAKVTNAASYTSFSIYTSPRPVQSPPAGTVYVATAWERSAVPGKQVCLRIREWSAAGAQLASAASCMTSTAAWQQFPSVSYTAQGGGSLEVYASLTGTVSGDSFELDGVSLTTGSAPPPPPPPPPGNGDPVMLAAGDIGNCATSGDEATASILDANAGTVAALGDNVYENGTAAEFASCYDPTWGRHKARTRPAVGNHEYQTAGAKPYYAYFGAAAGDPTKGYYSYEIGTWHVVVLNSNCSKITGGCGSAGAQATWLRSDLAAHPTACTLAYFHHPRFTSVTLSADGSTQALWQALYDANAELILNGHSHVYERFAPMTPTGVADSARGIREFIVGTGGGELHTNKATTRVANSQMFNDVTWGVLKLTLHASSYDWQFLPVAGKTFTDTGTTNCH